jgi:ribose 1,5-bisphosphokinase
VSGTFVCVVGPSGAGKDTLIRGAQRRLAGDPRFVFPRRLVTRSASAFEDHDVIAPDLFDELRSDGRFTLAWTAHGLGYAIPAEAKRALAEGAVVTCNLSRRAVADARSQLGDVAVVLVTAPRATLAQRLATRGRESAGTIAERLDRDPGADDLVPNCVIDNSGDVEAAIDLLTAVLQRFADGAGIEAPSMLSR